MKLSKFDTYIKAQLEVYVEGYFVERFINLCKINNIKIWDINYINEGRISFKVSPKEFKKLKPYVKRSKCKIKIKSKHGIYFNMFKYRKRRIALYLILALVILSFIMSSFVWSIKISGNSSIETESIKSVVEKFGMHIGKNKLFISKKDLADYIRANLYEVAWVGVDIKGTTMNITVKEKIISNEEDKTVLGDIVATKTAIITKIIAENGTAKYKTGSYIEKGSVAIEGTIYSEFIDPIKVHASGILKGNVEYIFEKEYLYNEKIKEYTGKSRHGVGAKINNKEIIIKCLPKENKYDITSNAINIFNTNISFLFNTYEEYILKDIVNTKDTLIKRGEQDLNLFLNELQENGKIVDKKVEIIEEKNKITYKAVVSVEENIGKFIKTGDK